MTPKAEHWAAEALPLMQHSLEHKQQLEAHMLRLQTLAQTTSRTASAAERWRATNSNCGDSCPRPATCSGCYAARHDRRQGKVVSIVAG